MSLTQVWERFKLEDAVIKRERILLNHSETLLRV